MPPFESSTHLGTTDTVMPSMNPTFAVDLAALQTVDIDQGMLTEVSAMPLPSIPVNNRSNVSNVLDVPNNYEITARAAPEKAGTLNTVSRITLFGSFFLGSDEFALAATSIREVVNLPDRITPIPLSPAFLEGIFTLRGTVIPVLNLARIFNPAAPVVTHSQTVVIVDYKGIQIGLLFERIGEILRVRPQQCNYLAYRDEASHKVVSGTIRFDDNARLLQILDPDALISIKNIPQIVALKSTSRQVQGNHYHLQTELRRCVAFRINGTPFAVEMSAIREIIEVPTLQNSVLADKLCLGRIDLRGNVVAVVDFARLLHIDNRSQVNPAEQRIVIAHIGEALIGLLVDCVDNLFSFFPGDLLPIPLLSETRAGMFSGCILKEGVGEVIFLNHAQIFSQEEVLSITRGHTELYQNKIEDKAQSGQNNASYRRQVYITFNIGATYAFEIAQIREIINFSDDVIRPPSVPAFIRGVLNLRRQMITLIDLRSLYGMPPLTDTTNAKILVIERGEERYGLMVDCVDSILTVPDSDRMPAPKMMRGQSTTDMRGEMQEVINIGNDTENRQTISVFEVDVLLQRLGREMAA
ncbi:MAG: chemotaxis protein CheW [Pseudomonadota bacterium]